MNYFPNTDFLKVKAQRSDRFENNVFKSIVSFSVLKMLTEGKNGNYSTISGEMYDCKLASRLVFWTVIMDKSNHAASQMIVKPFTSTKRL